MRARTSEGIVTLTTVDTATAGSGSADHLVSVEPRGGEAYQVSIGTHQVLVDQPADAGGEDSGPTPTELFIGSLAACVAYYAGRYLTRHGYSRDGLSVRASYRMANDRPARVSDITITVQVPADLPEQRRPALLAVASHCTVHNTITGQSTIDIELA